MSSEDTRTNLPVSLEVFKILPACFHQVIQSLEFTKVVSGTRHSVDKPIEVQARVIDLVRVAMCNPNPSAVYHLEYFTAFPSRFTLWILPTKSHSKITDRQKGCSVTPSPQSSQWSDNLCRCPRPSFVPQVSARPVLHTISPDRHTQWHQVSDNPCRLACCLETGYSFCPSSAPTR